MNCSRLLEATTLSSLLEMCVLLPSPSQKLPQRHSFDIVMWCWDYLNSTCDWTKLKPLYKLLRCGIQVRRSVLQLPKTRLVNKFPLLIKTADLGWYSITWISSCLLHIGVSFRLHLNRLWTQASLNVIWDSTWLIFKETESR